MKSSFFLATVLLSLILFPGVNVYSQDFWESTNGPEGGLVQCLAVDNNNTIYAGFKAGQFGPGHLGRGLYKSIDNGVSWQVINLNSNKNVQSITIDTSGTIFIWVLGVGVLKSTNNGNSWQQSSPGLLDNGVISSFKNNYIILGQQDGLYFSTNNGNSWVHNELEGNVHYIFVSNNDNAFVETDNHLYKSTDYGVSWAMVNMGLGGDVRAMTQSNDSILYAGTYSGVFTSDNFGDSWSFLENSPQGITSLEAGIYDEIYAGTINNGVFVSKDKGLSWQQKNNGLKIYNITSIAHLTTDQIIVGTFGGGLFTTYDNGLNWHSVNSGIKSVHITSFLKFRNILFAGSEQGIIYRTSDRGDSWEQIDSIYTNLPINSFTSTRRNSLLFSSNNGIYKSVDKGNTWFKISNLYSESFTTYVDTSSGIEYIFAATGIGWVYRSTDDGNNWALFNNGIGNDFVTSLKSNSTGYIFAATSNVIYRSTDFGISWEAIYEGSITTYHTYLAVSANDYLYAGFDWGKVILSTDNGETWINRGEDLPVNRVNSITTDSLNHVYVGNWWGEIYRSVDYGEHWKGISSGMIGGAILNLYCDNSGNIFVGPFGGSVYRGVRSTFIPPRVSLYFPPSGSDNKPISLEFSWLPSSFADYYRIQVSLSDEFDSTAIVFDKVTSDTVTTTTLSENTTYYWRVAASNQFGTGYWSNIWSFATMSITSVDDTTSIKFSFELLQNYPNPFNPTTKIRYEIPGQAQNDNMLVTLKVYDVLGNEVTTLVNEVKPAGSYEVEFDGSNLTSGVYFYRITAGSFVNVKKLLLLK